MALVTLKELTSKAQEAGYAVPAFNFWTYEDASCIIHAAEQMRSPVIVMASLSCMKHLGMQLTVSIVQSIAKEAAIPVVLHLDHAENPSTVIQAAAAGFTSVMYDGSKLPMEENIRNTQYVVKVAGALGVSVEAELGQLGRGEEGEETDQVLTDPSEAQEFVEKTGVDALAIAAGTMHGMQSQQADLRFDIIEEISRRLDTPLVLHGSSGVKNDDLPKAAETGICKINFGTKLRDTFVSSLRNVLTDDPSCRNHLNAFSAALQQVSLVVKEKIHFLGAENRI